MKPLFTLHLGARQKLRIPSEEVVAEASRRFDSFSLQTVEGWFCGEADPGWTIQIATELSDEVVTLATEMRRKFVQVGIGISVGGRYFRVVSGTDSKALESMLRAALPAVTPGV